MYIKQCSKCLQKKKSRLFYADNGKKDRLRSECKSCTAKMKDREKERQRSEAWVMHNYAKHIPRS